MVKVGHDMKHKYTKQLYKPGKTTGKKGVYIQSIVSVWNGNECPLFLRRCWWDLGLLLLGRIGSNVAVSGILLLAPMICMNRQTSASQVRSSALTEAVWRKLPNAMARSTAATCRTKSTAVSVLLYSATYPHYTKVDLQHCNGDWQVDSLATGHTVAP